MEKHLKTMTTPSPTSPSPTTFVQADQNNFKDLVQKLTGSSGNSSEKLPITVPTRLSSKPTNLPVEYPTGPRRSPFKLQDRRQTMRKLEIKLSLATINGGGGSSPSQMIHWVDSPIPSPVTPLGSESMFVPSSSGSQSPASPAVSEEEKAIAEKGFYLHPSPLSTPRQSEPPELLNLFPLTSPGHDQR
ncbi:VQ motif-containing protein 31-like [Humulus lupulus]|uniref:VQ motif-containing protein 31-like n=1 Tax=Humulus lupulus TaxID=3486 RepID=UPI002B40E776|nr:VQ motif-containing protein 31-like [Humulus lupulus]